MHLDNDIEIYKDMLLKGLENTLSFAKKVRAKGKDPSLEVETKIAEDVAGRVEGILSLKGIGSYIRKKEKEGKSRQEIAFEMAKEIARGEIIKGTREELVDKAVRVSVAILTEGVLVAPTEGISAVKIKKSSYGEYLSIYYAGPIRSAGGTVAALSILVGDLVRRELNLERWKPSQKMVARIVEEINLYDKVKRLQYKPTDEELELIVRNLPIEVAGDPTEKEEVQVNRDLDEVETNRLRGGVALVICEGFAQKISKFLKYASFLGLESEWEWAKALIKEKVEEEKIEIKPIEKYLEGAVAGRPIFAYPSEKGGFRLRYGRAYNTGLMAKAIHPATMFILDEFPAIGTQLRLERPGKAAALVSNESIEGPIVKLKDGSVVKIKTLEQAKDVKDKIDEILFLGDILIPYGDFSKSNSPMPPPGYVEEWWMAEAKKKNIYSHPKSFEEAVEISKKYGLPLHPNYLFYWDVVSADELERLAKNLVGKSINPLIVEEKRVLELMGVEHRAKDGKAIIQGETLKILLFTLGCEVEDGIIKQVRFLEEKGTVLERLSKASGVKIKAKGRTFIGARMGRPEKAKPRIMPGSPHVLFPTGKQYRSLNKLSEDKEVYLEVANFYCKRCRRRTYLPFCEVCGERTILFYVCRVCGKKTTSKMHCGVEGLAYSKMKLNFFDVYDRKKKELAYKGEVKGVQGLISKIKVPEPLEKGILRAKHGVYVFKDGTSRIDAIDVPLTHFKPSEIGVSLDKLRKLGYTKDYKGEELRSEDQIVPLKQQDVIIPYHLAEYFVRVSNFIDELLVKFYGERTFYNIKNIDDLVGVLIVGLSPHTSGAVLGRIIGFTDANVVYAHPYFHAAKRRNCDGDEDSLILLLDVFLNFSKSYLGESKGSTMDAPITLTTFINPKEIDDEAHEMECVWEYPLEFYEKIEKTAMPSDINIRIVKDMLDDNPYDQIPFTHFGSTLNKGNTRTSYVKLDSIPKKIEAEVRLMSKIRAVPTSKAVELVVNEHFIPDIYGNLRKYSKQQFRCVKCSTKYRRVPLIGKCYRCGGNLTLTVSKGGIVKYLDHALELVKRFNLSPYLSQRLELVRKEVEEMFEGGKKRVKITEFFG